MALLYISEYANIPNIAGNLNVVQEPALVEQTPISTAGAHTESSAFANNTNYIRVNVDSTNACCVLIGLAPVATTANKRLAANQTEYFKVTPGHKLSVITVGA